MEAGVDSLQVLEDVVIGLDYFLGEQNLMLAALEQEDDQTVLYLQAVSQQFVDGAPDCHEDVLSVPQSVVGVHVQAIHRESLQDLHSLLFCVLAQTGFRLVVQLGVGEDVGVVQTHVVDAEGELLLGVAVGLGRVHE